MDAQLRLTDPENDPLATGIELMDEKIKAGIVIEAAERSTHNSGYIPNLLVSVSVQIDNETTETKKHTYDKANTLSMPTHEETADRRVEHPRSRGDGRSRCGARIPGAPVVAARRWGWSQSKPLARRKAPKTRFCRQTSPRPSQIPGRARTRFSRRRKCACPGVISSVVVQDAESQREATPDRRQFRKDRNGRNWPASATAQ